MPRPLSPGSLVQVARDLGRPRFMMSRLWGRRASWQVRLRWGVPPALILAVLVGPSVGVVVEVRPLLYAAGFILLYNLAFALAFQRIPADRRSVHSHDRLHTILQVALDYAAMFYLVHFTGGPASPLIYFFLFHVIAAAMLFRPSTAYLFALLATVGMAAMAYAKYQGLIPCHAVFVGGEPITFLDRPEHLSLLLAFYSATVFAVAALTTRIMKRMRQGVHEVAQVTEQVALLNDQLNSLYAMVRAVGRERRLDPILSIVVSELAAVLDVAIVTVKLIDEERSILRYRASHGLPPEFGEENVIRLDQSDLNRRVIEERTVLQERLGGAEGFELQHPQLAAMGITWVLFAPLTVDDRVIGVLSAYRRDPRGFSETDPDFLRLAAELVAVAIEDARVNEEVQELMQERSRFMLQVAHNIRAPLGASISMMEMVTGGYIGEVTPETTEYLQRAERRLRGLNDTVGELLVLARTRDRTRATEAVLVDLVALAEQIDRSFRPRAEAKRIEYRVEAGRDLPAVRADPEMIEQILENLVSNAVKYTPEGGRVDVRFRPDGGSVVLEVEDTGIGIPEDERDHLFDEFYRATNARASDEPGTGLGLAIVKRTVERLGGTLSLESARDRGTHVRVEIPRAGN